MMDTIRISAVVPWSYEDLSLASIVAIALITVWAIPFLIPIGILYVLSLITLDVPN